MGEFKAKGRITWCNGKDTGSQGNTVTRGMYECCANLMAGNDEWRPSHIGYILGNSSQSYGNMTPSGDDTLDSAKSTIEGAVGDVKILAYPIDTIPKINAAESGASVTYFAISDREDRAIAGGTATLEDDADIVGLMLLARVDDEYKLLAWTTFNGDYPTKREGMELSLHWGIELGNVSGGPM